MISFFPALRRILAGSFVATAVMSGTLPPAAAANIEDPARTRLRAAYSKNIEGEWAESQSNWTQAALLYGDAAKLFGDLKRDYPGWQTDLLDRRITESHNRLENCKLQIQAGPDSPSQTPRAQHEDRLERLLEELTRVRAILSDDSKQASGDRSDPDLIRTNLLLQVEVKKLQKQLRLLEKQQTGHKRSPVNTAPAPTNSVCAPLIRETARNQIQAGQILPAIELLTEASLLYPDDPETTRLLATAYCRASQFRDAIRLVSEIPDPPPETLVILGSAYLATGQLGPARRTLEACLKTRPDLAEASYNMAQLLLALSPPDIAGARGYYRTSLESGGARDPNLESILGQATMMENIQKFKRK